MINDMAKLTVGEFAQLAKFISQKIGGQISEAFEAFCEAFDASPIAPSARAASIDAMRGHRIEGVSEKDAALVTYTETVQGVHFMCVWEKYGLNVLELSHSLAAGLILTEPGEYEPERFKLPFPALIVQLPQGTIPVWGVAKEMVWAKSLLLHRYTNLGEQWVRITLRTDRGTDLWFRRKVNSLYESDQPCSPVISPNAEMMEKEDEISFSMATRLIRNLCSWLESSGGMEKQARQTFPKTKKAEEKVRAAVWTLGREVKLSRDMREAASVVAQGRKAQEGWKLAVRFIVRGHWRNQAHGPGRSLRRQQWIEPFWKGPETGEQWSHLYKA